MNTKITSLFTALTLAVIFMGSPVSAQTAKKKLNRNLVCPSLDIHFSGPRYGDKINFNPTKNFFKDLISQSEWDKEISGLNFNFFASMGSCKMGEKNEIVNCSEKSIRPVSLTFSYSEKFGTSDFLQNVTITQYLKLYDWQLKVVLEPAIDTYTQQEIVIAKLIFTGTLESSEGVKVVHHEQKVGQWLNPIPAGRSNYGLCVFE